MPITITVPGPPSYIGPGAVVSLQSDFIGPLPTGSFWRVNILQTPDTSDIIWQQNITAGSTFTNLTVGYTGTKPFTSTQWMVPEATNVYVQVQLNPPTGTALDSGSATVQWSSTRDAWYLEKLKIEAVPQGLTSPQAALLAADHAAINPPLVATDGTPITGAVGDVIVRPSLKFLGIDTSTHVLTGSGTLPVPSLLGVQTGWGLVLDVITVPPGASFKSGYVRSFHPRVAQFLALWPAAHSAEAMVLQELRLHLEHYTWLWEYAFTSAVAYWIEPGWSVQARFVSAFFP